MILASPSGLAGERGSDTRTATPSDGFDFRIIAEDQCMMVNRSNVSHHFISPLRALLLLYDRLCLKLRAMSPVIRAYLSRTKDEYGDDYSEPTNAEDLSQVLRQNRVVPRGRTLGVYAMRDLSLIHI